MKKTFTLFSLILAFLLIATICFAQTGVWEELHPTNSPSPRCDFWMSEIGEGKAILFGGWGHDYVNYDETWIFDYRENTWTQINCNVHPSKRYDLRLARITKNKVLLFGGLYESDYYNDTWIFDLDSLKWTEITPQKIPNRRRSHSLTQLSEGKVVLFGGDTIVANYASDTWIFDITTNNWKCLPITQFQPRPPECEGGMIAPIDSGKILFYGGWDAGLLDETWLLDYDETKWKKIEPISKSIPISNSSMVNINKKQVVFFGGHTSMGHDNDLWLFDLNDTTWKNINTTIRPGGRYRHSIVKIGTNKVLLFGGNELEVGHLYNDTWLFILLPNEVEENSQDNFKNQNSFLIQNDKARITTNFFGFCNYKLYDVYGKVLKEYSQAGAWEQERTGTWDQESSYIDLDVSDLTNGVYFLVVQCEKKTEVIRVLVAK
ncbi:MAG: kelch repeat-containing protein [Bacteroidota bacterium]